MTEDVKSEANDNMLQVDELLLGAANSPSHKHISQWKKQDPNTELQMGKNFAV